MAHIVYVLGRISDSTLGAFEIFADYETDISPHGAESDRGERFREEAIAHGYMREEDRFFPLVALIDRHHRMVWAKANPTRADLEEAVRRKRSLEEFNY